MPPKSFWTDEILEAIERRLKAGEKLAALAAEYGGNTSRNNYASLSRVRQQRRNGISGIAKKKAPQKKCSCGSKFYPRLDFDQRMCSTCGERAASLSRQMGS